jgi:hypothetical protein
MGKGKKRENSEEGIKMHSEKVRCMQMGKLVNKNKIGSSGINYWP